ncbi:MAG: nucleotide sugar dehydrogenase [Coriobacteriia bacterium]|nr:nucleotide sugar dehydrogenase [Coriobacteriia bacterium]
MAEVCIIGMGYIGLPTALAFAQSGKTVCGVDISEDVCETINKGKIHIVEPGLEEVAQKVFIQGNLRAGTEPVPSDCYIIAVPTPITKDKKADLSYVKSAAQAVSKVLKSGNLVVLESTVPPRCTEDVLIPELEKSGLKAGKDFLVAHCPERVLPGKIMYELVHNNRIVGGIDEASAKAARDLYQSFVVGEMFLTSATTAELCKLMENTYRDVNIALANELALLSEQLGVDAWEVIKLANMHPRVNLHQPGPGVGGHCLAVDPWFIVEAQPNTAHIVGLARKTNDKMPHHVADLVEQNTKAKGKVVLLGATYKPDIDDMRESPTLETKEDLEERGFDVMVFEPHVPSGTQSIYEVAAGADTVVLCVHHTVFADIDFDHLAKVMAGKTILDTRAYFDSSKVNDAGLHYVCLGKGD